MELFIPTYMFFASSRHQSFCASDANLFFCSQCKSLYFICKKNTQMCPNHRNEFNIQYTEAPMAEKRKEHACRQLLWILTT